MEPTLNQRQMQEWLTKEWAEKLCEILESMADSRPDIVLPGTTEPAEDATAAATGPPADAAIWSQSFAILAEPSVWIATPHSTSLDLGRRTLLAAGVEDVGEEDAQNTFLEILNQSLSALGQAFGAHLACEASATTGEAAAKGPANPQWLPVRLKFGLETLEPLWIAASSSLVDRLVAGESPEETTAQASVPDVPLAPDPQPAMVSGSKTFDLLLDVALPVSVSFGRTFLPIKDVLKLNSGSIVELDRGVTEPVDVIVNNCVIARGEVVVVEGNYGVRIQQIASRHDRLRTGTGASHLPHLSLK